MLVLLADHETGDVLQKDQRDAALRAQLDEVRALQRRLGKQDAVVGDDADRHAVQVGESADQRRAVERLELVEFAVVDDAGDDFANIERLAQARRHDSVELVDRVARLARRAQLDIRSFLAIEPGDEVARERERVLVVGRQVIDDPGDPGVHVGATEFLGGDDFAGRGLDQRRAAEKDRALLLDDDRQVAHRRHVGAAGRARTHDDGDLRDAARRQPGLVVEDPAEMLAVGKHVILARQVRAARVDEVDARQVVFAGDRLRAQVFLDRDRVIGATLDRRVVGDDHALAPGDPADPADQAAGRNPVVAVHLVPGELADLEKRRAGVEQPVDAIARQQLAAFEMLLPRALAAALRNFVDLLPEIGDQRPHRVAIGGEFIGPRVDAGFEQAHAPSSRLRAMTSRWISLVPS